MDRPLRIAHCVEFYAPSSGGMQEVARQLSTRMVKAGHEVTVFTTRLAERTSDVIDGVRIRAFDVHGNTVTGLGGEVDAYVQALLTGGFDVVTFFAAQQWTTDAMLPHLHELHAVKVFVPTGFSALRTPRFAAYYTRMPEYLRAMDLNVFLSDDYQDIAFARAHGIRNTVLIPNGAAEEEFQAETPPTFDVRAELGITPGTLLLVHIGGYSGMKGHLEAIHIFLRAQRTKGATLLLIGHGLNAFRKHYRRKRWFIKPRLRAWLTGRRIVFLETDRVHTVAALRQADLFLFPSLIECSPVVLFESMAAGVPFLSSNAGNAEEIVRWTEGGWTIPGKKDEQGISLIDIDAGAHALDNILAAPVEMRRRGQNGHRQWLARFTWQRIADTYLTCYQRCIDERKR